MTTKKDPLVRGSDPHYVGMTLLAYGGDWGLFLKHNAPLTQS
jgi:hypothetical protein